MASLKTLPGLTQPPNPLGPPSQPPSPGQGLAARPPVASPGAAAPAPAFSPGPPPGLGLPRGCSAGPQREGPGCWAGRGRGSIPPDCVSGDIRWEAGCPGTQAHYPFWLRLLEFWWFWVTRINLNGSPFSCSEGGPSCQRSSTHSRASRGLLKTQAVAGSRQSCPALSEAVGVPHPGLHCWGFCSPLRGPPCPYQEGRELRSTDPTCSSPSPSTP